MSAILDQPAAAATPPRSSHPLLSRNGEPRRWPARLGLVGLGLVLLVGSGLFQAALNHQRSALNLTEMAPLENAPPVLAFTTVALGGFRGLIANALWIRANDLQAEGRYFEMVQLADWITKLEPTFTQVWIVQAWNMAFNISVQFTDFGDRWRWVRRGMELLRDDGLRYNPRDALMYRELGWLFQFKMGQNLDDAHNFYKAAWAAEMTELFGGPRPNLEELIAPTSDAARRRASLLRDKYKMDPLLMKQVEQRYGPMEWRLPESHAIYWAAVGLEKARRKELITLRRVIYQSMALATLRGRIVYVAPDGQLRTSPDFAKLQRANDAYEEMIRDDSEMGYAIQSAHRSFLREMSYLLYAYNRPNEASYWFNHLRRLYPDAIPRELSNVEEFALQRLAEQIPVMNQDRIRAVIEGLVRQFYFSLAIDQDDRAEGLDRMVRRLYAFYENKTAGRRDPLKLAPLPEIYASVRTELLDPQNGLPAELAARLRARTAGGPPAPKP